MTVLGEGPLFCSVTTYEPGVVGAPATVGAEKVVAPDTDPTTRFETAPAPVTVGTGTGVEPVAEATVVTLSLFAVFAAPNAFAICCATVMPALPPNVNVNGGELPGPPGTVEVAIILSVLTRGRSTPDVPGA